MMRAPAPQATPRPTVAEPEREGPVYVITDCGSTTTKAVLVGRRGGRYAVLARAEAPTTVEAPFADVTRGIWNELN